MMRVHRAAAWGADGPFWKLYELDARIMLLGVPYYRSTFWHLIEQWAQPAYGRWHGFTARIREADGTEGPLSFLGFGPGPTLRGDMTDFNKLGARLEARRLVSIGAVGNAMARLFRARDAFDYGLIEFRADPLLFRASGERPRHLLDGVIVGRAGQREVRRQPRPHVLAVDLYATRRKLNEIGSRRILSRPARRGRLHRPGAAA